jgi:hypothetical protein
MSTPLREREISRIRARLLRLGFPRLRMLVLILLTGGAGLLASYLMLRAGLLSMPLRYTLALLVAYGVFLLLVRWFVRHADLDLPDGSFSADRSHCGGSSDFVGTGHGGSNGSWLDAFDAADEWLLPLLFVIAVVAVTLASLWIVVSAPTLFAELAIDGALSAGLYRRLRKIETRHWLETAVRHTIGPFAATALALVLFAFAAQHYRPQAHSIGEVFAQPAAEASEP